MLLAVGLITVVGLTAISPGFSSGWSAFNYQLSSVALDQHPLALARTYGSRLRESEYGWGPLSLATPFNVTAARQALRRDYPEVASVFNGVPQVPRGLALKDANPAKYEERLAAYMQRHNQIESGRFTRLYDRDDMFSPPNANVKLGLFVTKLVGLPDAFIYTVGTLFAGGPAGIILFSTVLALSAMPLWRSRRPARTWLKIIVWPTLASALVWVAILIMAFSGRSVRRTHPQHVRPSPAGCPPLALRAGQSAAAPRRNAGAEQIGPGQMGRHRSPQTPAAFHQHHPSDRRGVRRPRKKPRIAPRL